MENSVKDKSIIINLILVGTAFLITMCSLQFELLRNNLIFIIFEILILIILGIYIATLLKNGKSALKNMRLIFFNCCGIVNLIMLVILFLPLKYEKNIQLYDTFVYIYLITGYVFYITSIYAYFYPLFQHHQEKQFEEIGNFYQTLSTPLDDQKIKKVEDIITNRKKLNIFLRPYEISNSDINSEYLRGNLTKLKNSNIYAFNILKVYCKKRCNTHLWQAAAITVPLCLSFSLSKFQIVFKNKASHLNIDWIIFVISIISIIWIGKETIRDIVEIPYKDFYEVITSILKEI